MVKLFGRKKQQNPQAGFGTGEWEWWEKEDTHIFRRALSLGSAPTGEYNGEYGQRAGIDFEFGHCWQRAGQTQCKLCELTSSDVRRWQDGKPYGQGVLEVRGGHRYEGSWKHGRPDGSGHCRYPDGTIYDGAFKNGLPHGQGARTWGDGSTEIGNFAEGKLHGRGKTVNDDKDVYEGQFVHGVPNGEGEFTFEDGDWFRGTVENGVPLDGKCLQTVETDGQFGDAFFEFLGSVKNGVWNGEGKLTLYEHRSSSKRARLEQYRLYTYEGHFKDGKFDGHGKKEQLRDNDGGDGGGGGGWLYEGEWKDDVMSGQGKLMYKSGALFEGSFKHGKPHGACKFTAPDGQYKEGTWARGELVEGRARVLWEDGRVYEGGMVNGQMDGQGAMEWGNGDKLEGEFEQGLFPQRGILVTGNGIRRSVKLDEGFLHNLQGRRAEGGVLPNYLHAPDAS